MLLSTPATFTTVLTLTMPGALDVAKPTGSKRKKAARVLRCSGYVSFPLDLFEHCTQQSNDIEFTGIDILQVAPPASS